MIAIEPGAAFEATPSSVPQHIGEVTFVPDDPPRRGAFALWGPAPGEGEGRPGTLEMAVPARTSARRNTVPVRLLPIAQALPWLAGLPARPAPPTSLDAWAVAVKAGCGLVARGRLFPAVTGSGFDTWRVGPLDRADEEWLRSLAAAFPPPAHARAIGGSRPLRVPSAEDSIRACWDAIADTLARSPAAPDTVSHPAFAGHHPVAIGPLRDWLETATRGLGHGARPGLRLDPPQEGEKDGEEAFTAVLQLRSQVDPSLVVDAADLWSAPAAVLNRLGEAAESDLLLALRRGSRIWAPLGRALDEARPDRLQLTDAEATELLGPVADDLAGAGLEVLWPRELLRGDLQLRAVVGTPTPPSARPAGFTLDQMLEFKWELVLGGEALTPEEVDALAEAKRPLIRLRGRWIAADQTLLARLRARRPGRVGAGEALAAALGGGLEIDGEKVEARVLGPLQHLSSRLREIQAGGELPEPAGLVAELRPYQRRGLAWLAAMSELGIGGCLADDMGLGKTIQVIALHLLRDRGPMLVLCPASLLGNWERELHRFAPGIPVRRYHGGGRHLDDLAPREVVLATYGVIRRDQEEVGAVAWDLAVADEAQHAKNPYSSTARAIRRLPAAARIALTGTPVENRLSELWSILDWTTPGLLGKLDGFRRRVAVPIERYNDPEVTERFARVIRPFLLRRRKTDPDIAPELPPKQEADVVVPLTPEQVTLYEALVRETMAAIDKKKGIERSGLVFKLLTGLKQICNHPAHYLKQAGPLTGRSGKLEGLDELLEVIVAEGDSALIFTQYTSMARLLEGHLARRGITSLFLHGGVEPRRRDEMVLRFQAGEVPIFLLSLKAGGVGLNLTQATHVIHYDRWWNPAVEDQATDRAHRIGQDRPVQVHRLVTEGTVEDRIAALLISKRELAESVVGGGEAWISELSDRELSDLVELRKDG